MKRMIVISLAVIIAIILVHQAGKRSGKQLNDLPLTPPIAQQTDSASFAPTIIVEANSVEAKVAVVADTLLATEPTAVYVVADAEPAIYDLTQLVQLTEHETTLNLTDKLLQLDLEQFQQALWQLEQHATQTSTHQRQQQLLQQFINNEIGTLVQLNCSNLLCIAMLQYDDLQNRNMAMPLLSELANAENVKATFLSKNQNGQYYNFFMMYGWR